MRTLPTLTVTYHGCPETPKLTETQSAGKCGDALRSVVSLLRDAVAHPIRSLIVDPESCKKLWEQIDQIEGVLFHLR
jgi:hypothetical protein